MSSRTRSAARTLVSAWRDDLERPDRIALVVFLVVVMIIVIVPAIRSYVIDGILAPVWFMIVLGVNLIATALF